MKQFLPPQVTRLVGLTIAIVAAYFIARHFLVPESFGMYGWFRGDALTEIAATPAQYAGRGVCLECHDDEAKLQATSKHHSVACETCHGPSLIHANNSDIKPQRIPDAAFCKRCHEASPSRPKDFPQIEVADHAGEQACTECHNPHSPMEDPS